MSPTKEKLLGEDDEEKEDKNVLKIKIKTSNQIQEDEIDAEDAEIYDSEAHLNVASIKKGRQYKPKRKVIFLKHSL